MNKKGFTLTEVLIGVTLVLLVLAADASIRGMSMGYLSKVSSRSITQTEAAIAMASVLKAINAAGYAYIPNSDGRTLVLAQDTPPAAGAYPDPNAVGKFTASPFDTKLTFSPDKTTPATPIYNLKIARVKGFTPQSTERYGGNKIYDVKFEAYPDNTQNQSNAIKVTIIAEPIFDSDASDRVTLQCTAVLGGRSSGIQGISNVP